MRGLLVTSIVSLGLASAACLEASLAPEVESPPGSTSADASTGAGSDAGGSDDGRPSQDAVVADGSAEGSCGACASGFTCELDGRCHEKTSLGGYRNSRLAVGDDEIFSAHVYQYARHVYRYSKTPGAGPPTLVKDFTTDTLRGFATDGTDFFYSGHDTAAFTDPATQGIFRCPAADCSSTARIELVHGPHVDLALDGDYLYWIDPSTRDVVRCGKAGCGGAPERVAPAPPQVNAVAYFSFDANTIFVAYASGFVGSVPRGLDGSFTPITTAPGIVSLAGSSTDLFWISGDFVYRCAKAGCAAPTLVAGPTKGARSLVVEGTQLYWLAGETLPAHLYSTTTLGDPLTLITDVAAGAMTYGSGGFPADALATDGTYLYATGAGVTRITK